MIRVNGVIREETSEEITRRKDDAKRYEAQERHRPLSDQEVLKLMIRQNVQTLSVDDATAVRMRDRYPEWSNLIGQKAIAGQKFTHENDLYEVNKPGDHVFSKTWVPGKGTESLYRLIPEFYAGDQYDPIHYKGNMKLEKGKYYMQDGVLYRCIRDTGNPVFNPLADLIGNYVEMVPVE